MVREKAEVEAAKGAVEGQAGRLTQEAERLRRRAQELENEVAKLNRIIDEAKLQESRLGDRAGRLEVRCQDAKRGSQSQNCTDAVFFVFDKLLVLFLYLHSSTLYRLIIKSSVSLTERQEAAGRVSG